MLARGDVQLEEVLVGGIGSWGKSEEKSKDACKLSPLKYRSWELILLQILLLFML